LGAIVITVVSGKYQSYMYRTAMHDYRLVRKNEPWRTPTEAGYISSARRGGRIFLAADLARLLFLVPPSSQRRCLGQSLRRLVRTGIVIVDWPLQCTGHSACRGLLACPISLTDFAIPPWQVAGGMHDIYAGTCRYRTSAASILSSSLSHLHLNKYTVTLSSYHAPLQQPRKWQP
jgi:hypothetical protein